MRHIILQFTAAGALTLAAITTADAHASLEPDQAPAGSYKAVIGIPHGCDGQPTHTVRVEIPEGFVGVKPMPKPGWTLAVESGDYDRAYELHGREVGDGPLAVTWSGGSLDDAYYDEFVLTGTLAGVEAGQVLAFRTTQLCAGGEVAWTELPAAGQNPHELDHPAPALTILASSGDGNHHHGDGTADAVTAGDLAIGSAWARAMLPNQPTGGAYLTIANNGEAADRLVAVTSPRAGRVEIHSMEVVDDVMTMRPVEGGLEIPAGETVALEPGGLHLMFMEVAEPFAEGQAIPVTLQFETAGSVDISIAVRKAGAATDAHHGHH